MRYKGYTIEVERGGWGWNISVFLGTKEIFSEVGYEKRSIAVDDARYVVDSHIEDGAEENETSAK